MPESPDYYRGAAEAIEAACMDRSQGGICQRVAVDYLEWVGREPLAEQLHRRPVIRLSVIDAEELMNRAVAIRDQKLSALPAPIEATPDLPRGKPLVYEDPSPEDWELVETCEAAFTSIVRNRVNDVGRCVESHCDCSECLANIGISAIQAARQARGK